MQYGLWYHSVIVHRIAYADGKRKIARDVRRNKRVEPSDKLREWTTSCHGCWTKRALEILDGNDDERMRIMVKRGVA